MKLRTYLDGLPRGGITEFAGLIEISSVYLSQLAAEQDGRVPSPELCLTFETATDGKVTRQDLRPNDFWKIWPDLRHLAPSDAAPAQPTAKTQHEEALEDAAQPVLLVTGDRRHESHLPDPDLERREPAAAELQAKEASEAGKRK